MFTVNWKVLLKFLKMKNVLFFQAKIDRKDDIYWLLRNSCFELFGGVKYGLFLSGEIDWNMVFTD